MSNNKGKISQIIGPVMDIVFNDKDQVLPKIYDALEITKSDGKVIIVECQQHMVKIQSVLYQWTQLTV